MHAGVGSAIEGHTSGSQALVHGLAVLSALVDERRPMSPTELGERVGIHQSSVSRILAGLTHAGYVRKTAGRRFTPDFGVLALAGAAHDLDLVLKPRAAVEGVAGKRPGTTVKLGILWRGDIIYFLRAIQGTETVDFLGSGYPLHLSATSLRLLLNVPEAEAIEALGRSKQRHGWARPTNAVPSDENEALATARGLLSHDILILKGWRHSRTVEGAIPLNTDEEAPVALSITTPEGLISCADLALCLHEARHAIEESLRRLER